ncbi:MAG: nucleotidyltransferase domain-containing protein [Nanoarchaeota archaeon]|nr:nucleotidyltransferase domain-containing protein [Nanoarchaeota archaeon]
MVKNKFSLKEKILKYLIENKESKSSIRKISQQLNTDYKNTFNIINCFPEIISKEKIGNTNKIKLKLIPNKEIYSIEEKRTKDFLEKNKQLKLLHEDIMSINYPFFIVLLFGSYVKKTQTKKSDIDICIISDNKEKTKELISKFNLLPLPLEIQEFSFNEFESMVKTKEVNLSDEIIKKNILLYGIENYYNLISKWMKIE